MCDLTGTPARREAILTFVRDDQVTELTDAAGQPKSRCHHEPPRISLEPSGLPKNGPPKPFPPGLTDWKMIERAGPVGPGLGDSPDNHSLAKGPVRLLLPGANFLFGTACLSELLSETNGFHAPGWGRSDQCARRRSGRPFYACSAWVTERPPRELPVLRACLNPVSGNLPPLADGRCGYAGLSNRPETRFGGDPARREEAIAKKLYAVRVFVEGADSRSTLRRWSPTRSNSRKSHRRARGAWRSSGTERLTMVPVRGSRIVRVMTQPLLAR